MHKFGGKDDDDGAEGKAATKAFVDALRKVPPGWRAQGDLHVFVDECHRTQSGDPKNGSYPGAASAGGGIGKAI